MENIKINQNEKGIIINKYIEASYVYNLSESICFNYLKYFKQYKAQFEDIKFNYIGDNAGKQWEITGNNFEISLWAKFLEQRITLTIELSKDFNKEIPIL